MSTYTNYVLTNTQRAELANKISQGEVQGNYGDAYSYLKSTVPWDIAPVDMAALKLWLSVAEATNTNDGGFMTLL